MPGVFSFLDCAGVGPVVLVMDAAEELDIRVIEWEVEAEELETPEAGQT